MAEITGLYGVTVKRFSRKLLGDLPEPVGVFWHNTPVLKSYFSLGQKSQKWHEYDENLKSFAHMAAASLLGCTWCLDFGYFMAHIDGLDEAKAREVPRWRESDAFTPLERDVVEYGEARRRDAPQPHSLTDGGGLSRPVPLRPDLWFTANGLDSFYARVVGPEAPRGRRSHS